MRVLQLFKSSGCSCFLYFFIVWHDFSIPWTLLLEYLMVGLLGVFFFLFWSYILKFESWVSIVWSLCKWLSPVEGAIVCNLNHSSCWVLPWVGVLYDNLIDGMLLNLFDWWLTNEWRAKGVGDDWKWMGKRVYQSNGYDNFWNLELHSNDKYLFLDCSDRSHRTWPPTCIMKLSGAMLY